MKKLAVFSVLAFAVLAAIVLFNNPQYGDASSHREAPLISNDPLADNTDLYAFRAADDPNSVVIVANYIPLELPEGGPNYSTFGENIRYEIHIKNQVSKGLLGSAKDDITYRFTFEQINQDATTFFNIRLGQQNLKTTYTCEKSTNGGETFTAIINDGVVPPNNIGPRSIEGGAGLNSTYSALVQDAIETASSGEVVFCGPRDDVFFVDLGGVFDLGQTRNDFGADPSNSENARDAVAGFNTHAIVMKIPIENLQKDGKGADQAANILDGDFVIGVWASASRPRITTLSPTGAKPQVSSDFVQVSRLGMPLVNEAIIPLGDKDYWNAVTPYSADEQNFIGYFANPELGLYMGNGAFGTAVPALSNSLVIPMHSYPAVGDPDNDGSVGFNFNNGADGVFDLAEAGADLSGTAFGVPLAGGLAGDNQPRLVDLYPIFYFGVPNLKPYQLATGKTGGPLSDGKPFIHNFLPITHDVEGFFFGGDMLRLNMATPVTPRDNDEYRVNARMGLIRAAALGLTAAPYNTSKDLEFIPHMDGFPNGRRLEDDVTTIELQAVGGLVLAAVGVPFDDAVAGNYSDLASPLLVAALTYNAGPTKNDLDILNAFPYLPDPHRGYDYVKQLTAEGPELPTGVGGGIGVSVPKAFIIDQNFPNPFNPATTIQYHVKVGDRVKIRIFNALGQEVETVLDDYRAPGTYSLSWDASNLASGAYFYRLEVGGDVLQVKKAMLLK